MKFFTLNRCHGSSPVLLMPLLCMFAYIKFRYFTCKYVCRAQNLWSWYYSNVSPKKGEHSRSFKKRFGYFDFFSVIIFRRSLTCQNDLLVWTWRNVMFLPLHLRVGFYVAKFHVHSCIALKALKSLKYLDRQQKTKILIRFTDCLWRRMKEDTVLTMDLLWRTDF